jgi:hypothetical protein
MHLKESELKTKHYLNKIKIMAYIISIFFPEIIRESFIVKFSMRDIVNILNEEERIELILLLLTLNSMQKAGINWNRKIIRKFIFFRFSINLRS